MHSFISRRARRVRATISSTTQLRFLSNPHSDPQEFLGWCDRLYSYLQTLENRLFSEGLHVLGAPPSNSQMAQYLGAYYGDALPVEAVDALAEGQGVERARTALEKAWSQVCGGCFVCF